MSSLRLDEGDVALVGLLQGASNYTLLGKIVDDNEELLVVYKPRRGEAPLWDFPTGTLCSREVAASLVCDRLGFGFVPQTILREGPYGVGSVQLFVDHDPSVTAFDLIDSHVDELRRVALFDLVVNNADRKGGHVLVDEQGNLFAIDHGVCFHHEPKLRTVIWDFVGEPIPEASLNALSDLCTELHDDLGRSLAPLLSTQEIAAISTRTEGLLATRVYPAPGPGRPYPWPPI